MRENCVSFAELLTGVFTDTIARTLSVEILKDLDELEVTMSQLQTLTLLAEHEPCSIGGIADSVGVTHPAAVKLVDKLVAKGLALRGVAQTDHRQAAIRITSLGRRLVNRVRAERTQRLARVLDSMQADEREALIRGLQGFVSAALQGEQTLDRLCGSCQALLPTDCDDFRPLPRRAAGEALAVL